MIKYLKPRNWIQYDILKVAGQLATTKATVLSLTTMPYQRSWADKLQVIQLKREVEGTSRIEGADFTDKELDAAMRESPEKLLTRSQRQAAAAVSTYRWIAQLPDDRPIDAALIRETHRRMITGADEDHCPPGQVRRQDENVTFGNPRHRGAEGGAECEQAFADFCRAIQGEFRGHDPLVRALAVHYHFAAMHPFLDGNGRTARALEALALQREGLKDTLFIAMSNYYYEEKSAYLTALAEVRAHDQDLTAFLLFGLRGIAQQCQRLLNEIQTNVRKALFRNMMYDLFPRLKSPRARVMAKRQLAILRIILDVDSILASDLLARTDSLYNGLRNPRKAQIRDLTYLISLGSINFEKGPEKDGRFSACLEWPTEITETEFFAQVKQMPKAKSQSFLG
jgi:Fic family protein